MTDPAEVAAFMRAIIGRPDDDVPRLVFADYLDERGKAERAEFIRVQCELARLKLTCPCRGYYCTSLTCDWTNDYGSLRRSERELLTAKGPYLWDESTVNGDYWIPAECYRMDSFQARRYEDCFRRGFVESITCSWSDWQRHADAIRAATPLQRVRLTTWPILADLPRVTMGTDLTGTLDVPATLSINYPGIKFELLPPPIRFIRESGPVSG